MFLVKLCRVIEPDKLFLLWRGLLKTQKLGNYLFMGKTYLFIAYSFIYGQKGIIVYLYSLIKPRVKVYVYENSWFLTNFKNTGNAGSTVRKHFSEAAFAKPNVTLTKTGSYY